jgi:soluble lytic murein transglycosylase-like protein
MIPPMAALFVGMLLAFLSQNLAPTAEVQFWSSSIVRWATEAGVDPNLAATVMQIESCGDPRARSSAGAMGLFQVMPWHFRPLEDTYDPDTNALRGLAYLKAAMEKSGNNVRLALAGYNGGGLPRRNATSIGEVESTRMLAGETMKAPACKNG